MTTVFKPGDRVRVKDLRNLIKKVRGTLGTVTDEPQPGWCFVSLDAMGGRKFAFEYDHLEPAPASPTMAGEFKPGDLVRVTDAYVMGVNATSVLIETGPHRIWLDPSKLEPAPASSPDTPEARAAGERDGLLSARIEAILRDQIVMRWGTASNTSWIEGFAEAAAIIDRHTAKARETALREKDEADRQKHAMQAMLAAACDDADAVRAALSSEQSAHAETRKALDETEDALEHLRSIAHHI